MTDRPILFSAPMVKALLSGTKTQTRRIIKPDKYGAYPLYNKNKLGGTISIHPIDTSTKYAPGDRLYVRESFSYDVMDHGHGMPMLCWYWADGNPMAGDWSKPKPSIHMPLWASRMTLEVTCARVERVQDISDEDARAEGTDPQFRTVIPVNGEPKGAKEPYEMPASYRAGFANLWDSINRERGYGWDANPWVAAVSFKVHKTNIAAMEKAE